ncbi:MAG: inorganic phosphate transporter family protein [Spirochaeta sp.]|nr:inorganic phosphate transporter family protein [Spirochaeta sp.]
MEVAGLLFLSSGLYMGWSLGANDAANIFGAAVGTRMIPFRSAAVICAVFITLGAVISGAGAAEGLSRLGAVNTLAGAFVVSGAAATTVMWMTRVGLPVSTTQAIVGAIVGWNLYSGSPTDSTALSKIVGTWVYGPILGAAIAFVLFFVVRTVLRRVKVHLITLDKYTRFAMIFAGAFGAYSLGANNMANVVGVFVPVSPFRDFTFMGLTMTGVQQLFLVGGLATAVGVATYSKKVMMTIGAHLYKLSPITAIVVIVSTATVLFLFASEGLKLWLDSMGLPSFPLVPVSQSQAAVGSVIGVSLAKGGRNLNLVLLRHIFVGWVATPVAAAILCYVALFFMQNVFMQTVYR